MAQLTHRMWMDRALVQARAAEEGGDVPIGAVIVRDGEVLAAAGNRREADTDPTAHAEILVLRDAARRLGSWRLERCALYVTLEPCAMCAGALVLARLPRLVYGTADPKAGAVRSLYAIPTDPRLNHRVEVVEGVAADECAALLRRFFRSRRAGGGGQAGTGPNERHPRAGLASLDGPGGVA